MQQISMVLDVEIAENGGTHRASYVVDHGVIHARIGDRIMLRPVGDGDAAEMVSALLRGHLLRDAQEVALWHRRC